MTTWSRADLARTSAGTVRLALQPITDILAADHVVQHITRAAKARPSEGDQT
ncbi:hypothetical protein [Streptomyces litmocidini]|uniref:hypothetical protein n=1 Tax=Streptomyces litmocidini TaxID=67318 RepID=UPI0036FBD4E8